MKKTKETQQSKIINKIFKKVEKKQTLKKTKQQKKNNILKNTTIQKV